jgi:hypothetical protein
MSGFERRRPIVEVEDLNIPASLQAPSAVSIPMAARPLLLPYGQIGW